MLKELFPGLGSLIELSAACVCVCGCTSSDPSADDTSDDKKGEGKPGTDPLPT